MTLRVKVKPGSRRQQIDEAPDGTLVIHLKSPPIEGKANLELIEVLSDRYRVPKSSIRIRSGASGRNKLVELPG